MYGFGVVFVVKLLEEYQENAKHKLDVAKEKYHELVASVSHKNRRVLDAFPRIQTLRYKRQLQELKDFL